MNPTTRPAKFELVKQHLVSVIDGGLAPHEKLPTERDLADEFEISRLTVRRALDQLENDGVVYRVRGAGTFVSEQRISKSFELTSFSDDMRARGLTPGSLSVTVATIPAGARIGYALKLSPAEPVVHIRRIRTADNAPMCFENSYLPDALVPELTEHLGTRSLYEVLEEQFSIRLERADQTINATVLDPETATLLQAPPFSPSFLVTRTGYDRRGRAIEFAETLYRGDRYSYELSVLRPGSHRES
ncbi:GntR family transcriptional regulator [Glaciibacter psychrotolerans]